MSAEFVSTSAPELFDRLFGEADDPMYLLNPSQRVIRDLVEWGVDHRDTFPEMKLLAEEWTLKRALSSFTVASRAADLIDAGGLAIRYDEDPPNSTVAVDGERLVAIVGLDDRYGAFTTTDDSFVTDLHATGSRSFDTAESYAFHTPPLSRIERTLEDRMGEHRRTDFVAYVDAVETLGVTLDEVVISLLVAANNEDLLYDISKWGEDIGLASKATFSRKKADLEEAGIIDTEKEPIEVGRPRLRLKFADASFADLTPVDQVERTAERLN